MSILRAHILIIVITMFFFSNPAVEPILFPELFVSLPSIGKKTSLEGVFLVRVHWMVMMGSCEREHFTSEETEMEECV